MYTAKNYDNLLGFDGLSDDLLNNHFKLYQGYVNNTNKVLELLEKHEKTSYEFGELKRRLGWEFNGMRLHELYFENISKEQTELSKESGLGKLIEQNFGSMKKLQDDFVATGAMRGIGWVVLYYDEEAKRLINTWINEHDMGHLSGVKPLLIMDCFEHAYLTDFGLNKKDYIDVFTTHINWPAVEKRFNQ